MIWDDQKVRGAFDQQQRDLQPALWLFDNAAQVHL
jgi:hypothetical protein